MAWTLIGFLFSDAEIKSSLDPSETLIKVLILEKKKKFTAQSFKKEMSEVDSFTESSFLPFSLMLEGFVFFMLKVLNNKVIDLH